MIHLASVSAHRTASLKRLLVTAYLILALAATGRSLYQVVRKFAEAPLAYSLSVVAAVVYVVATVAVLRDYRRLAWVALVFELVGVLVVGGLSVAVPQLFAHPAVWSYFGAGYLFIPLILPVLGMLWLRQSAGGGSRNTVEAKELQGENAQF